MNRIISVSREFGSGGRELGKRLAEALGVPCYDRAIIDMIAEQENMDRHYVASVSEKHIQTFYPGTIGRHFAMLPAFVTDNQISKVRSRQHQLLVELANQGSCVVVGRCADIVLREMEPFKIFVCADEVTKIKRCRQRSSREEGLTDKEIKRKIKEIDSNRKAYRSIYTEEKWGDPKAYHLCVNTSERDIKSFVPGIVNLINDWFENRYGGGDQHELN